MATAGTINIFVNAVTKKFDDGIANVHKKLSGLTKNFADINGALMVAQAAFGAAAKVVATFTDEIARLDEIGDTAERLNITADSLVKLQRAAQLTGGEVEGVAKSLAIMQRTLGDAAMGNSGPVAALKKLGFEARDLIDLELGDAFQKIVDKISKLPTPAQRASIAADIFGKSASNLTGLMTQGSSAIQDATREIDNFGATLDETRMKSIDEATKSMERLSMSWQGLKSEVALATAPALSNAADFTAKGIAGQRKGTPGLFDVIASTMFGIGGQLFAGNRMFQRMQTPGGAPAQPGERPQFVGPLGGASALGPQSDSLAGYMRGFSLRPRHPLGPEAAAGGNPFSALVGLRELVGGTFGSAARNLSMGGATPALEFGSQAAFSAVNQSRREDEMAKLQKQEIEETKKTNKILERGFENAIILSELDLQG